MTTVTRNWFTEPDGSLCLEISVVVNGETLRTRNTTSPARLYGMGYVDYRYIEQDMRRQLMASVESRLFGLTR